MPSAIDLRTPLSLPAALRFPLQSPGARRDLLLGALWLVVPGIGWLLNMGHRIVMVHRMQHGLPPTDAWREYGQLLKHGAITALGMLLYASPGLLALAAALRLEQPALLALAALLLTAAVLAIPGYMSHYCHRFDPRELFSPARALSRVRQGGSQYWRAWGIAIVALTLSFTGLLAFGLGFLVTSVWFWQVAGFAFASVFSQRFALDGRLSASVSTADTDDLLRAEQVAYYRAVALEYESLALPGWGGQEAAAALDAFRPEGDVLELACGPGMWTELLGRYARSVTALDAAPEMLARARARVDPGRVRFLQADLFSWTPDRLYDVVFFGFWLSHVPKERFEWFWSLVSECLQPAGRVFFVDDAVRTADELIEGEGSSTIQRRLSDGTAYRLIKIAYPAADLEAQLAGLGWSFKITQTSGSFYWGAGRRSQLRGGRPS